MDTKPRVSIVAAISAYDRGIGKNGKLLWHISDDLRRFKKITKGHPVIMGRKTFGSIVGYLNGPLPERTNIVVTRDKTYSYPNVIVAHSLEKALRKAKEIDNEEVFIGGGANLWAQTLPLVDKLYLTLIDDKREADSFFPEYEKEFTKETFREAHETKDGLRYIWVNLEQD